MATARVIFGPMSWWRPFSSFFFRGRLEPQSAGLLWPRAPSGFFGFLAYS